ncbi:MAG TPA: twin-arginine translocase subunit TatC [Candidatus Methanoperedens sp.]
MAMEDFSRMIVELRKKLLYIAMVFGAGVILSFPYMEKIIRKIEYDLFYGLTLDLNIPDEFSYAKRISQISHNLSVISNQVNNSIVSKDLTGISRELSNISQNLNSTGLKIVTLTPLEALMLEFKMSLIVGAVVALPLVLYYAYRGFKGRIPDGISINKSLVIITVLSSIILFSLGAAYSYFFMLPAFMQYVIKDALSIGAVPNYSLYEFIYFIVMTTIILGFAFELPLIMILLTRLGVTSRQTLAHYRKHAYIVLLIIAAWITPDPTMFSQLMVALPFVVLYEVSLIVLKVTGK